MSFLDVVSCGFGAILLLLVISKIAEPVVIEQISADLTGVVSELQTEIDTQQAETEGVASALSAASEKLAQREEVLARLRRELSAVRGKYSGTSKSLQTQAAIEGELADARQELSEEMRRLLGENYRRPVADSTIGGVPVDSEYIIFIIDTSGSMQQNAWALVGRKMAEILDIYPQVKGIQVMNDMGDYMFSQYARRWIPDTPARRNAILKRLRTWAPFSNSSPVEGITAAIRTFYSPDRKISLYVFGDEFSEGSAESVVRAVGAINRADRAGNRRVRIHGVGFPVQFQYQGVGQLTGIRFAALMRVLAEKNGGSFVGLRSFRP